MKHLPSILPNTIVKFHADYSEDDGKPTKKRYHLVIEANSAKQEIILLKITSRWKNYFLQTKLGKVKCLSKLSFANLNRIIILDWSTWHSDYRKFYICQIHQGHCVEKRRFTKVLKKLRKFWENPLNRDLLKIRLVWNNLKVMS